MTTRSGRKTEEEENEIEDEHARPGEEEGRNPAGTNTQEVHPTPKPKGKKVTWREKLIDEFGNENSGASSHILLIPEVDGLKKIVMPYL